MSNNGKLFIHNTLVEICFRLEDSLYFTSTPYMKEIFISCLATAQTMYKLQICHFVLMANHLHMLVVVEDTTSVSNVVGYLKKETAHAINRLLGRKRHTVWNADYDSPTILDYDTAISRIVYLYTNPQKANLVDKIEHYPNCNSWEAFQNNGCVINTKRIPRDAYTKLPRGTLSLKQQIDFTNALKSKAKRKCKLDCFGIESCN